MTVTIAFSVPENILGLTPSFRKHPATRPTVTTLFPTFPCPQLEKVCCFLHPHKSINSLKLKLGILFFHWVVLISPNPYKSPYLFPTLPFKVPCLNMGLSF
ncbi:hypothetical protein RJT34_01802 [Clitoria ternatea]|uniref:Uncharacterized protein n=1 Tax=Clitoria ternatea TaxID=43366 RepID=A0AAN9KH31_CLITE